MIKLENTEVIGWEHAIRGMRNPMNSWEKSDSLFFDDSEGHVCKIGQGMELDFIELGHNDHKLMMSLAKGGPVHAKYRRMINVYVDITAPLYWWKEFDTYKVGTVANSCSTMHKIHAKEFLLEDFSTDHLEDFSWNRLGDLVEYLNVCRTNFLITKDKRWWWQMIQLLPSSYNQKRTVMLNYEVLANMYRSRKSHKLDEWISLCEWIKTLPYSELITSE